MNMSDRELTDLVRQMATPPPPPTYGEAEIEELVRMHAGGRHKMRSEAEILARYNLGRQQYKQLKLSRENNRRQLAYETVSRRLTEAGVRIAPDTFRLDVLQRNAPSDLFILD